MRPSLLVFISVFQLILLAAHFMVFETWMYFWVPTFFAGVLVLKAGLLILSISFVAGSLLSFRYWNAPVRAVYRLAAVWLGIFNFLFLAALGAWLSKLAASL